MNNPFMRSRVYRYFNVANPRNYQSKEAQEGITRTTVREQEDATGEVHKH